MIEEFFQTPEGVIEYIEGTGLKKILQNKQIHNLVDYVFGIETGLDTNARKNRSGYIMEQRIATLLRSYDISFRQEVYSSAFPEMQCLGSDLKRFDFVISSHIKTY